MYIKLHMKDATDMNTYTHLYTHTCPNFCICFTPLQGWAAGCGQGQSTGCWLWVLNTSASRPPTCSWCTGRPACLAPVLPLTAHWQARMQSAWTCARSVLHHKVRNPFLPQLLPVARSHDCLWHTGPLLLLMSRRHSCCRTSKGANQSV